MSNIQIILASGSRWRRRLLKKHGILCKVHVSRFEEKIHHQNPRVLVLHNACGKAFAVAKHYKNAVVIGVDTIGVFKGKILGKPKNRQAAKKMLASLSGNTHRVVSGLCVVHTGTGKKITTAVTTKISFRKIPPEALEKYLDNGQWKGKAGSYAIQGRAKGFVKKIEGDVTNVVGLPVFALKKILQNSVGPPARVRVSWVPERVLPKGRGASPSVVRRARGGNRRLPPEK